VNRCHTSATPSGSDVASWSVAIAARTPRGAPAGLGPLLGDWSRPHATPIDGGLGRGDVAFATEDVGPQSGGRNPGDLGQLTHAHQLLAGELGCGEGHHAAVQWLVRGSAGRPGRQVLSPAGHGRGGQVDLPDLKNPRQCPVISGVGCGDGGVEQVRRSDRRRCRDRARGVLLAGAVPHL